MSSKVCDLWNDGARRELEVVDDETTEDRLVRRSQSIIVEGLNSEGSGGQETRAVPRFCGFRRSLFPVLHEAALETLEYAIAKTVLRSSHETWMLTSSGHEQRA